MGPPSPAWERPPPLPPPPLSSSASPRDFLLLPPHPLLFLLHARNERKNARNLRARRFSSGRHHAGTTRVKQPSRLSRGAGFGGQPALQTLCFQSLCPFLSPPREPGSRTVVELGPVGVKALLGPDTRIPLTPALPAGAHSLNDLPVISPDQQLVPALGLTPGGTGCLLSPPATPWPPLGSSWRGALTHKAAGGVCSQQEAH